MFCVFIYCLTSSAPFLSGAAIMKEGEKWYQFRQNVFDKGATYTQLTVYWVHLA